MSQPWDISIAAKSGGPVRLAGVATGEPSGGSQPGGLRRIGPYSIDHAELVGPTDGTYQRTLYVPEVGSWVHSCFFDPTTSVDFAGADGDLYLSQDPDPQSNNHYWILWAIDANANAALEAWEAVPRRTAGANFQQRAVPIETDDPVIFQYTFNGGGTPSAGHLDLYFMISDPA